MSTEHQAVLQDLGEPFDRLCTLDLRPPGPTSGYIGRFYQAVRALTAAPLALTAARCLHQIMPQSTVIIATGFCHPERLPYGETDGPPGAASLARAVRCGLACTPLIIGETAIAAPVQACVESLGLYFHRETWRQPARTPRCRLPGLPDRGRGSSGSGAATRSRAPPGSAGGN